MLSLLKIIFLSSEGNSAVHIGSDQSSPLAESEIISLEPRNDCQ